MFVCKGSTRIPQGIPEMPESREMSPLSSTTEWSSPGRDALASLPVIALLAAAAVGAAAAAHLLLRVDDVLGAVLPVDTRPADPVAAVAGVIGFAAIALGLARRNRLAWSLAMVTFAAGLVVQGVVFRHPVGATLAATCLLRLVATRGRYDVAGPTGVRGWLGIGLGVLAVGVVAEVAFSVVAAADASPTARLSDAAATLAGSLAFTDVPQVAWLVGHGGLLAAAVLAVRLPMAFLAVGALRPAPMPAPDPALRARAQDVTRRFGHGALLPFQLGDDKLAFAPDVTEGVVVYGLAGRYAVVLGDPIGRNGEAWVAFDEFLETSRRRGQVPAVYQASAGARGPLVDRGFRVIQVGREAIVDLASFDLAGSRRANLRHTVTRARKGGVSVSVHLDGLAPKERVHLERELTAIDDAWRAHSGPELGFTIGRFDPSGLDIIAISVAEQGDGTPIAFATFRPTGTDGGWVLDLMRRLPGGIPGAFEACVAEAALALRAAGASTLSLGLVPLGGLTSRSVVLDERLLARVAGAIRPWYDVSGLEFFKRKFDPAWEPRFIAVRSRRHLLGLVVALLRLHLGGFGHSARTTLLSAVRPGPAPRSLLPGRVSLEDR